MKTYSTFLLFIFAISIAFAQQEKSSLAKKWTKMLEDAETYEPYKVIKKVELQDFWKNNADSIAKYLRAVKVEKNTVAQQTQKIAALKNNLEQANVGLEQLKKEKDAISFLGISANKYFYLSVLYLIILASIVIIVMLFSLYKNSKVVTVQKVNAFQKIEQEFSEYKQAKFEVEKKLKRELQTKINELTELKRKS